jgi:hypothetical protein
LDETAVHVDRRHSRDRVPLGLREEAHSAARDHPLEPISARVSATATF